jgi:hypothetical protein
MTPAIEELEAALEWNERQIEYVKNLDSGSGDLAPMTTIRDTLTQAIAIARGDKVVVPREPTKRMMNAFYDAMRYRGFQIIDMGGITCKPVYKAMIDAAQDGK